LIFVERNCLSCHSVAGSGGQIASRLDGIGLRRDRASIVSTLASVETHKLSDADKESNNIVMSPSALSPREIEKVSDYLMSLPHYK